MAQSVAWFSGFESGDFGELNSVGSGGTVQGTTTRSGAYALTLTTSGSAYFLEAGLASTQTVFRGYLNIAAVPGSTIDVVGFRTAAANRLHLELKSTGIFQVREGPGTPMGLTTTSGTAVLALGQWYRIELIEDLAAGGVVKLLINGTVDIDTTHINDVTGTPTDNVPIFGLTGSSFYWDDLRIDTGGLTAIGAGQCIARQPLTGGTPTYNDFTKSSGSDAGALWDNTPFDTTDFCSSSTSAHVQTAVISSFSAVQTGHGVQIINPRDTINACKSVVVAKRATSGNPSIRRRIGGADTDTARAMTASDAHYDDNVWTTTLASLNTAEIGVLKAADTNLTTVEDVWLMVDYTPSGGGRMFAFF